MCVVRRTPIYVRAWTELQPHEIFAGAVVGANQTAYTLGKRLRVSRRPDVRGPPGKSPPSRVRA